MSHEYKVNTTCSIHGKLVQAGETISLSEPIKSRFLDPVKAAKSVVKKARQPKKSK